MNINGWIYDVLESKKYPQRENIIFFITGHVAACFH